MPQPQIAAPVDWPPGPLDVPQASGAARAVLSASRTLRPPGRVLRRAEQFALGGVVLALHAAVIYWAIEQPTAVLPVVPPQIPPMTLEFSQPAPPPVVEPPSPPPQASPAPEPPPVQDELASKPPPPPKPKPVAKPAPKPPPKAVPAPPQPAPPKAETPPPAPAPPPPPPAAPAPVTPPSASAGYLKNPAPEYPALAQRRGWEGTVLLRVHVLASGRPGEVQVQQSAGRQQLDEAALAAVKRWSFVPAKQGDQAVDGWVTVPIDFKIR